MRLSLRRLSMGIPEQLAQVQEKVPEWHSSFSSKDLCLSSAPTMDPHGDIYVMFNSPQLRVIGALHYAIKHH